MSIAGAGFGAGKALEQILAEQMVRAQMAAREREAQSRTQLDRDRLNETIRTNDIDAGQRQQTIDLQDRSRRDRNNAQGLELMGQDRARIDEEQILSGLSPQLRTIAGLRKVGVSGISPEDLQSPEERANALKADEERQIRIRRASQAPTKPEEKKPMVVTMPDGSIKDMNNVLPPGAVPYDPVAARSSKPEDVKEATDTAREVKRIASALRNHAGLNGAFGAIGARIPTVRQGTADAEVLLNSLTSLMTLENMGKMKGVLSDSDMKVLRQASSTISPSMSEGAARAELDRIVEVMSKVTGDAPAQAGGAVDPRVQALIDKYKPK